MSDGQMRRLPLDRTEISDGPERHVECAATE